MEFVARAASPGTHPEEERSMGMQVHRNVRRVFVRLSVTVEATLVLACVSGLAAPALRAAPIDYRMVTVGDAGNAPDRTGYGAVDYVYRIGKYEFTMAEYTAFLNAVDPEGTNPNGIYHESMGGGQPRSGIFYRPRNAHGARYEVETNWDAKPINLVSWFDAARVANWLHAGGLSYGTTAAGAAATDGGAYTLNGATTGVAPARNPGARYWIPTENEWYKAAYYKGGGLAAGYWRYATRSDSTPVAVNATADGTGTTGGVSPVTSGNFANYAFGATWYETHGNLTTVGTNGGPSPSGAVDMSGNIDEWNDLDGSAGPTRGNRGGTWATFMENQDFLSSSVRHPYFDPAWETLETGFRLAASVDAAPVPEIDPTGMGSVLAVVAGTLGMLEHRRVHDRRRRAVGAGSPGSLPTPEDRA
jgi:formylglycine-generating enzyme required for sulfatase activity